VSRLLRGWHRPAVHWPSVRGRAVADAGSLLLAATVVTVVTLLAGAGPPLLHATADNAVHDAVRHAGADADLQVHARWERDDGPSGGRVRDPHLADDLDNFRGRAAGELDPGLQAVLRAPVMTVTSPTLKVTGGEAPRTFQLTYLVNDHGPDSGPHLTWIAGGPPEAAVPPLDRAIEAPYDGPPWLVQVGLSEADAQVLGMGPGAHIPLVDDQGHVKNVEVSGVFRATDGDEPAWRLVPGLLQPVPGGGGAGTTRLAGLLSPESLPDAILAFEQDQMQPTVWFAPDPDKLTVDAAPTISATVVALKANSGSSSVLDSTLKWQTQLDAVLRNARAQVDAASAQASVLLTGVLTAAVLILLLAADLLVRRRGPALATARQRGAALPDLATELLLESGVVAVSAAAVGLALARAGAPGVSWIWAIPVVLAAVGAGPAFGALTAARATGDRRVAANRSARQWSHRGRQLRRAAVEVAVVIAAVAAFVALNQRGIAPAGSGEHADAALPAAAPTLGVLAGALVVLRLLPAGTRLALRQAMRSRRPLAVFGAARAAATSARVLPLLVLVSCAALASFSLTLAATVDRGLADGAWGSVGADARLDLAPTDAAATARVAQHIAAAPGVLQTVTAQVTDGARVVTGSTMATPRLVIVDADAFRRLLASTPLPDAPALARLTATGQDAIPALVRSGGGVLHSGTRLELLRDGAPAIRLIAVGTAPAVDDAGDVVILDAAAAAAAGVSATPNTIWVTGPGAATAVTTNAAGGEVVLREDVLRTRGTAPLTSGLLRLALTSTGTLMVLGLLGLALGAATGAPGRWQTLARLRTLGLRSRDAPWVGAGELVPPVAVSAVGGPLLGVLLAGVTLGPLDLQQLTQQTTEPTLTLPWWAFGLVTVTLLTAVAVVIPVESALRRRHRLAEVLHAGEPLPVYDLG